MEGGTEVSTTTSKSIPTSQIVKVDFLYLDLTICSRCRASDATLNAAVEIVRPMLDSVGASIEVRKSLVETEEQARTLGFVSSPTIRVNGRDIAGEDQDQGYIRLPQWMPLLLNWCQKGPRGMLTSSTTSHFTCKTADFRSGAEGIRTPDLRRAKAALSRLSYGPLDQG